MSDLLCSHIRDGESDYSLCSRKWKHVSLADPGNPLCFHCEKERDRRARRSGTMALTDRRPAAHFVAVVGYVGDAAPSVAEKLPGRR